MATALSCRAKRVYVPYVDEHNVLTFRLEESGGKAPDPVDLNPFDEWENIDKNDMQSDYTWESM